MATALSAATSLHDQVYEELRARLLRRRHVPGEKLSLHELAAELGVSRSPVHHALTRLVSEGLLTVKARRGYFVTPVTAHALAEGYDVRLALELHAAERTAEALQAMVPATARVIRGGELTEIPAVDLVPKPAAWARVCIPAFSAARLRAARRLLARPVCMATSPVGAAALRSGLPGQLLRPAFARRSVRCAQLPIGLATAPLIGRAHGAGLQVHIWTVNDRDLMTSLLDLGVDGIMTDNTELLRDVLIDRGEWHPRA